MAALELWADRPVTEPMEVEPIVHAAVAVLLTALLTGAAVPASPAHPATAARAGPNTPIWLWAPHAPVMPGRPGPPGDPVGATARAPAQAAAPGAARIAASVAARRLERVPLLRAPVAGPIVRGFEAPAGPYGPGHRGVDFGVALGTRVLAPAAGRVIFAGTVAGLAWMAVEVAPGVVVSLGPLAGPLPTPGTTLAAGAPAGAVAPGHDGTLHLGLRIDGSYVDPLPYLAGNGPPRLAPLRDPGGLPA